MNKSLFYLTSKCLKASQLDLVHQCPRYLSLIFKPCRRRYLYVLSNLPVYQTLECNQSARLYSVVGEELAHQKDSYSVIKVPSIHFEDVTFDSSVPHEDLCSALHKCNSVEEQMKILTTVLALSNEDIQRRFKFCETIESLLKPFFGSIKIHLFGSSVNGYGFKGCDLDMSFETSADNKENDYLEPPDVPLITEVLSGKVSPTEISQLPLKEQLIFIHTVLLEFYRETEVPIIYINAHVPLVRFHHDRYNLKCDLSIRNKVAYINTKLLHLCGKMDDRVVSLMMTIRYWAKYVDLIGKGLMFNTYTISLLVVHFLQKCNPPILPSVEHILSVSDSLLIEDMCDTSFLDIIKKIPPSENKKSADELLREFFEFYLFFDFTRVICPIIGDSISREEFFTEHTSKKFKMNAICVQDPILPNHNVAELVSFKQCKKLVTELMASCIVLADKNYNLPSTTAPWGLLAMFNKPDECNPVVFRRNFFFSVPLVSTEKCEKDSQLLTAEAVLCILQQVLLFDCKVLDDSEIETTLKNNDEDFKKYKEHLAAMYNRQQEYLGIAKKHKAGENPVFKEKPMLEDFRQFNRDHKLILGAKCKVSKNTWLGRNFVKLDDLPPDVLNKRMLKEKQISIRVAKVNEQNNALGKNKILHFLFECYEAPDSSLLINLRPLQRTYFNIILGIFLKEYIPKLIRNSVR